MVRPSQGRGERVVVVTGGDRSPSARSSRRHPSAAGRVWISFGAGVLVMAASLPFVAWQASTLLGWNAAAIVFVAWVWADVLRADASTTERIAMGEDSSRGAAEIVVIAACVASLGGVGAVLVEASSAHGAARAAFTAVGVAAVVLSWLAVNTVFMLRYAHLYYRDRGGIEFPGGLDPRYADFAYLAFTVGMTFQVSDTQVSSGSIRMTCLRHALVAYLFGIVIVAMTINVVASLLRG